MSMRVRPWVVAVGVVPLALLLSGCLGVPGLPGPGDAGDPGGGPDVDELIEEIVEASGDEVDFESDVLPAGFPEADVPLVPGEVGPGMALTDGTAWSVTIYAADEATANTAPDLLEAAGYENDSQVFWENEAYRVVIVGTVRHDDGRWAVTYQVQTR